MIKNLNITPFVTLRPFSPTFDYKERCLCFHRKNKYMCTVKFHCLYHSILRPVHYKDHIQYYATNFTVIKLLFCYKDHSLCVQKVVFIVELYCSNQIGLEHFSYIKWSKYRSGLNYTGGLFEEVVLDLSVVHCLQMDAENESQDTGDIWMRQKPKITVE